MAKFQKMQHVTDGKVDTYVKTRASVGKETGEVSYETVYETERVEGKRQPVLDAEGNKIPVTTDEVAYYEEIDGDTVHTSPEFQSLFDERAAAAETERASLKAAADSFVANPRTPGKRSLSVISPEAYNGLDDAQKEAVQQIALGLREYAEVAAVYPELFDVPMDLERTGEGEEAKGGLKDFHDNVSKALTQALGGLYQGPRTNLKNLEAGSPQYAVVKHLMDVRSVKSSSSNKLLVDQKLAQLEVPGKSIYIGRSKSGKAIMSEPLPEGYKGWGEYQAKAITEPRQHLQAMDNCMSQAYELCGRDTAKLNDLVSKLDLSGFEGAVADYEAASADFARADEAIEAAGEKVMEERSASAEWQAPGAKASERTVDAPEETVEDEAEESIRF